jgi:signal transduction histidine kinase
MGIDPVIVRLALVVLSTAGGFGVAVYLIGWLAGAERELEPSERRAPPSSATRQVVAAGLVVAGVLVLLQAVGLWFGNGLVLSVGLAAFGSALIWTRSDDQNRARLSRMVSRLPLSPVEDGAGRIPMLRLVAGALLVIAGMATFLAASNVLRAAGQVAVAVAVTAAGVALILGPWMLRSARQLGEERRQRIRSEERAELAAHLHDSVLQTLALIQRSSDPRQMAILARGQERELRGWLYGRSRAATSEGDQLSVVLEEFAGRIERMYAVPVDLVSVGDCPMDDRLRAMVEAASEAIANAARHSGATVVSVYAEATPEEVRIYVRDQGRGFDPAAVPAGRRGIAESIRGRMERHGGSAGISSAGGEGTEVDLRMPRKAA